MRGGKTLHRGIRTPGRSKEQPFHERANGSDVRFVEATSGGCSLVQLANLLLNLQREGVVCRDFSRMRNPPPAFDRR